MIQGQATLKSADFKLARKYAFQFLYQQDLNQQFFLHTSTLKNFIDQSEVSDNQREFLNAFLEKIFQSIQDVDALIEKHARNWKITRIAKVDLAVLRVACVELIDRLDTDVPVIISEAASLAQEYGSANSSSFVNGVLDAIAKEVRKKIGMREVFILENMASCQQFVNEQLQNGLAPEDFLGVGNFSSTVNAGMDEGIKVKVLPKFLEEDVIQYIVQGHVEAFESEPILIQPAQHQLSISVPKWLVLGQMGKSLSHEKTTLSIAPQMSLEKLAEDFVNQYFSNLFHHVSGIQAKVLVFLLDVDMLKNNCLSFFSRRDNDTHAASKGVLEQTMVKEILYFLSNAFFKSKVVIVPSHKENYKLLINKIHEIKVELDSYASDIVFKL